jgi:magnesium chelatase family protein
MISKIFTSALYGIEAYKMTVEVYVGRGLGFYLSGLPDDAIKECRNRIEIALHSNGYEMPRTKLSINLAPADVRKIGTGYDLPIAIGILLASGQVHDLGKLSDYLIVGELGLDGCIYGTHGALSMAICAKREGFKGIIVPYEDAEEATLQGKIAVYGGKHLRELISFISSDGALNPIENKTDFKPKGILLDFNEVRGQQQVKRGLEIAAAGNHNSLIIGSPGIGKTMLAKRLPSILPPMTIIEALEATQIYSVYQKERVKQLITQRPFRSPHHTISDAALAGGGSIPGPGEISLAHNGVLFLDELPEFRRAVIEVLRQPLEERKITIARAKGILEFPASFMFLASMNPCVCGYYRHPTRLCTCSKRSIYWYRRKISGPLLDRIDLHIEAEPISTREIMEDSMLPESSYSIRERVLRAKQKQWERFKESAIRSNAQIPERDLHFYCKVEEHARKYLAKIMNQYSMTARSYGRILKVARTIADLANKNLIEMSHVAEAVHFRNFDKPLVIEYDRKTKSIYNSDANEIIKDQLLNKISSELRQTIP